MKVIVFDLDDTLYDELTYVRSGFRAVSRHLSQMHDLEESYTMELMNEALTLGRGQIFDQVLEKCGRYSKREVWACVQAYRQHVPSLQLDEAAERCLLHYQDRPIYIVTDGNKLVQHNKLMSLGLYGRVNKCYITHRYGKANAKPSPYCFMQIAKRERVSPSDIVYIGDNPHKDFVGIRPLGFRTVRIMRGSHKEVAKPLNYEAEFRIDTLDQLRTIVI